MKITVVGAGIAGLSSAWTLNKRGHAVTLVEQGPIPNPLAASGDHHRIIRRAYRPDSGYASVITEAFAAWEELWRDLGESHFEARGFMGVSREPGDEAEEYRKGTGGGCLSLRHDDARRRRAPLSIPGAPYLPLRLCVSGRGYALLPGNRRRSSPPPAHRRCTGAGEHRCYGRRPGARRRYVARR